MQLKKWLILAPLTVTLLSGCSIAERLVYRIDINQGNYVEQPAVDQLRVGMSQDQVRYVLGSPMLVESGYPNTWYYIYHHTPGHQKSEQKNLVVQFDNNGTLASIDGDFTASSSFNSRLQ